MTIASGTHYFPAAPTYEALVLPDDSGTSFRWVLMMASRTGSWSSASMPLKSTTPEDARIEAELAARDMISSMGLS